MEPPTTPIGRDELALRRHRFFSDLLNAAHAAVEHRVRFDPLGPFVAKEEDEVYPGSDASNSKTFLSWLLLCFAFLAKYVAYYIFLSPFFLIKYRFCCLSKTFPSSSLVSVVRGKRLSVTRRLQY